MKKIICFLKELFQARTAREKIRTENEMNLYIYRLSKLDY